MVLVILIDKFIFGYKFLYKKDCEIFKFFNNFFFLIKVMYKVLEI